MLKEVSADSDDWIANLIRSRCLDAKMNMDAFHRVQWAIDALDEVRREAWNQAS